MHYSDINEQASTMDPAILAVGDTFDCNDTRYTVVYASKAGPFNWGTTAPIPMFVVSHAGSDGKTYYQVAQFTGDWEGCCPLAESVQDAMGYEIQRIAEIEIERYEK